MDEIAPPNLAESWDNPGLQIGDRTWPVNKIVLALDASTHVVSAACKEKANLLITHHPLIFKAPRSIDFNTPLGKIIQTCITHRLSVFSAHTNYDSVSGGVNDILAKKIGLTHLLPLQPAPSATSEKYKLVVFTPAAHQERVREALFRSGCGHIGNYSGCSFAVNGLGTFYPEKGATPFTGQPERLNQVEEVRMESVLARESITATIENVKKVHPYETVAYDLYPLFSEAGAHGLGRVGELPEAIPFETFVSEMKTRLGLQTVKTTGASSHLVKKVALCSGSGSSLLSHFFQSGADCYVSGDLRYHDAKLIEEKGKLMADIGHFASEHIVLEALKHKLQTIFSERKIEVDIQCCDLEKDPFHYM